MESFTHNWISHADIMNCGILHFEMGDKPNITRGLALEDKAFSLSKSEQRRKWKKNHCRFRDEK